MVEPPGKRVVVSPILYMALSALFWPRTALPALPPANTDVSVQQSDAVAPAVAPRAAMPAETAPGSTSTWAFPPVRLGGTVSYDIRSDTGEGRKMVQRGLITTLTAASETFIWQPWFAQLGGKLNLSLARNTSDSKDNDFASNSSTRSAVVTGAGQLRVLPQSRYPFEAHLERNNSRISTELISVNEYTSQRAGFTQHYLRPEGDAMIGWDRSTQTSDSSGRDQQDTLQLNLTHSLQLHRLQVNGNHSKNTHERTGEYATQDNLSVQHSYMPDQTLSFETMTNVGKSAYHLDSGDNRTHVLQLSNLAFWRPTDKPLAVTGGARVLALAAESTSSGFAAPADTSVRNANANAGVTYDLTQFTHLNASANANLADVNGKRTTNGNQSAGVNYQPEARKLGNFQYNWSTAATIANRFGGDGGGRQLGLQFSHALSRNVQFSEASSMSTDLSQTLSVISGSGSINNANASRKQVTHGGSVSWNLNKDSSSALVRFSASDSRALDGNQEYFQMINFQASSNLPASGYSSWNGNLTFQAVRQGAGNMLDVLNEPQTGSLRRNYAVSDKFVTTSSGALTYQNQRVFGVRRLRFVSDLRLNSQALLPLLGGPRDQEMVAWENRVDYSIGRTQLRVSALVAQTSSPATSRAADGTQQIHSNTRLNKAIMFTVLRSFGDL